MQVGKSSFQVEDDNKQDLTVRDIVFKIRAAVKYVKKRWLAILLCAIIGGGAGFAYASFKKPLYVATSSFVLEDGGKGGGLGQYAGLASLAGIDLGGGGGVFEGDNILELYKSRFMIKSALLSPVQVDGKHELLIDLYADFNDLNGFRKKPEDAPVNFNGDPDKFSRVQDSIINNLVKAINYDILDVKKLDKKLNIITVEVKTKNELFSKEFNEKLVGTVNDFYSKTKTKKSTQNLHILQRQADSVKNVLNGSIGGVANTMDAVPNANPALSSLRVPSQKRQIDVQANSAIYAEITKNLEISKISLRQESPLIQIIDKPLYPLDVEKTGKIKALLIGAILAATISILVIVLRKIFEMVLNQN